MVRRTPELAEETRTAIVVAARRHFAERGYAPSSLAAIADEAGVTKGGLLHHFPNKDALFLEVWTQMQVMMDADTRAAAAASRSSSDPFAAFLAGCRRYLDWASRADFQQVVLIDGPSVLGARRWYELDQKLGEDNVRAGVEWLIRKGIVKDGEARPLAVLIQSTLNGAGFAISRKEAGLTSTELFGTFERMVRSLAR